MDNWFPPNPKNVPCCVLQSGYRPLSEAYCCSYALPTDLEIQALTFETYRKYSPEFNGTGYRCCVGRII